MTKGFWAPLIWDDSIVWRIFGYLILTSCHCLNNERESRKPGPLVVFQYFPAYFGPILGPSARIGRGSKVWYLSDHNSLSLLARQVTHWFIINSWDKISKVNHQDRMTSSILSTLWYSNMAIEQIEHLHGWFSHECAQSGGLEHFLFFHSVGNVIIPTDFHIFQRGRHTTNQTI